MEVIGRRGEQERVDRFLDALPDGPAALVLEGAPGIGKTTVWRGAVGAGRRRSYRVLVCRASESEAALSFLGLGDLLDRVSDEALERSSGTPASGAGAGASPIRGRGLAGSRQPGAGRAGPASSVGRGRRRRCWRSTTCSGSIRPRPMSCASSLIDSPTSESDSWCPCETARRGPSSSIRPFPRTGSSAYASSRSRSRSSKRSFGRISRSRSRDRPGALCTGSREGIRSSHSSSPRRSSGEDGDRRARSCRSRRRLRTRCASGSRRSRRVPGRRSYPSPPWRSRPWP